jgi:ergothioneine biosynthesis protein EgtB
VPLAASIAAPRDLEADRSAPLLERFGEVRAFSERLCAALDPEDLVAQSMPDCSPLKWHLAHTSWFFEAMVLEAFAPPGEPYTPYHPSFGYLFNSYYNAIGERHARPQRGVLTRPTVREVAAYRRAVDEAMHRFLERKALPRRDEALRIVELGLQHERQHQELMLTDLKHLFAQNALAPAYRLPLEVGGRAPASQGWVAYQAGVREIGHAGPGFGFDNEMPRHRVFLEAFSLADRLVTNAEYRAFVEDGGYREPAVWLDAGWAVVQREAWERPLYWRETPDGLAEFTLAGLRELAPAEPVSHLSYVEADAFARWAGARLPTEAEWECAAATQPVEGNFVATGRLHPAPALGEPGGPDQLFGDVWEWTSSAYSPYPGYRPEAGALGEYNGKFMCDQLVLRGGSCASSQDHLRATYRNFFRSSDRWQFSGVRLARDR